MGAMAGPREATERAGPSQADARELMAWLRAREEDMAELAAALARAESPSTDPRSQEHVRAVLAAELIDLGHRVREPAARGGGRHLLASPADRRREGPYQLLVGHLDTVWPVGTLEQMPVRMDGGRLFGPGVFDMKAGLAQAIFALRALQAAGAEPEVAPVLMISCDEEIGSRDSGRHLARLARGAARALVLEPAFGRDGALKTRRKAVGAFSVTVLGRAAHAGIDPDSGVSAILELSHQVQRLFALNDPDRGITVNVGTIDGGLRPNVIAPEARASLDVRVPTAADAAHVEQAIRGLRPHLPGVTLRVEGGFGRPAMEATARNRRLWERARTHAERLGIALEEAAVGGASDGNTTSLHTATLDGLGAVGDGAHAAHEHVVIAAMPERAALLALLMLEPDARRPGGP
jgi:glutamate carboxypeptidase